MDALNHWVLHKFSSLDLLDPTSTYIYICTVVYIYIYSTYYCRCIGYLSCYIDWI